MIDEKLANRTYFIYKCVAVREDNSTIERLIKIQSYFNIEDLAISLVIMADEPRLVKEMTIKTDYYTNLFSSRKKIHKESYRLFKLGENKNIEIEIKYEDKPVLRYDCEYVGQDTRAERINRITPICLFAKGYLRYGYQKYKANRNETGLFNLMESLSSDYGYVDYIKTEDSQIELVVNDLKRLFTSYKDEYYY